MEPEQTTAVATTQPDKTAIGRLSPIFFLAGVFLFFLPFVDIRCNNVSLQQVSGINLATGFKIKTTNNGSLFDNMNQSNNGDFTILKDGEESKPNGYALVALVAGISGLILSLLTFKGREWLGIITGVGAAAALIGLMADIRSQLKLNLSAKTDNINIRLAVDFTPWFYITILVFLIGAFLSYLMVREK